MLNLFTTKIVDPDWGTYFVLTQTGYLALILVLLALLLVGAYITKSRKISTKQLVFCSMALALGVVASYLKLAKMPMGGSVTLLSMLFISMIGYWYGLRTGIATAIAYGVLQMLIDPYIISLPQLFFDYIFAFGALGFSGFFCNAKNGLYKGYLASILGRFLFAVISGIAFFASSAEGSGFSAPLYSIIYNGSYIFSEAALTFVVIALPPVRKTLQMIKQSALQN